MDFVTFVIELITLVLAHTSVRPVIFNVGEIAPLGAI